jgi:hypothetical protein
MISMYEKAYSFTRPSDTTAYASGDLIANSTTAGSVVPLSWAFPSNAPSLISAIRLTISTALVTNATFRLHLLNAIPTFTAAGDNSAFGTVVATGYDKLIASYEGTLSMLTADGAAGLLVPVDGMVIPVLKKPTAAVSTLLYGALEARAAYVPASASVWTATLILEK